jgi:hypothetical protein
MKLGRSMSRVRAVMWQKQNSAAVQRVRLSTSTGRGWEMTGVWPIMPTPFTVDERLDIAAFEKSVDFLARAGVDGVTIIGVLGESNRLLDREREELISTAVRAADGRMRVCAGTSHPGTHATAALSQMAQELGADAVMVTPSKEPTNTDDALFKYFQTVAQSISIPMVLQDHPASTQVSMSLPLQARIAKEVGGGGVCCFKLESLPTPPRIGQLKHLMQGHRVPILTGLGALYVCFYFLYDQKPIRVDHVASLFFVIRYGHFDLAQGTDGFMTGFAFPEVLKTMVNLMNAGNTVHFPILS